MAALNREAEMIQNPALGAMLLWRFAAGYAKGSGTEDATPLPLLFLVLPICLHQDTASLAQTTKTSSGLRMFAGKFSESRNLKSDLLLAVHGRASRMRTLTLLSLRIALKSKLILLEPREGLAQPGSFTPRLAGISQSIKDMLKIAEKLGNWCGPLSIHEVALILKLRF